MTGEHRPCKAMLTAVKPGTSQACTQLKPSTLFHPDYTVGPGFAPDPPLIIDETGRGLGAARLTAGREFHPALKV